MSQLRAIFSHYSKITIKPLGTFDDMKEDHELLTLPKVMTFLHDFNVEIPSKLAVEIFKKCAA